MYYPRSFLKFILLGFLLVSLPLVYALAELILSVERMQTQAQEAVQQAAEAGRASRQLFEQAATLERIVRQDLILDDPALLDDYARVRQEFVRTVDQLETLPFEVKAKLALKDLAASEATLQALLVAPHRGADAPARLAEGYARLTDAAQVTLVATNQITDGATQRLRETAAEGRQKWMYLAGASVGIAVALAIMFAVLIARPIRQLDQAIRQMGTADFSHAIEVNGPQDMRYLGQRLEWLRSRLYELEEQQNRFLRHVSHELKTPLTAVREGAELLRDEVAGELSPSQLDIVRIVRENTLQLQKLIEDLLNYHQTRATEPESLAPVALADIVLRVIAEQKLAALGRMVMLDTRLAPVKVFGNADRIRTIVDNLLSNAIKYSPRSGTVRIELTTEPRAAVLDVIDEGHGVDPSERERIFESFYQGSAPMEGRVKGSGLGLAIARDYAVAHGGRIDVQGRADGRRGAHFRLTLPLHSEGAGGRSGDAVADRLAAVTTMTEGK